MWPTLFRLSSSSVKFCQNCLLTGVWVRIFVYNFKNPFHYVDSLTIWVNSVSKVPLVFRYEPAGWGLINRANVIPSVFARIFLLIYSKVAKEFCYMHEFHMLTYEITMKSVVLWWWRRRKGFNEPKNPKNAFFPVNAESGIPQSQ